eukprot:jgi/Botrbrau1/6920/Bobra.0215s0002.1
MAGLVKKLQFQEKSHCAFATLHSGYILRNPTKVRRQPLVSAQFVGGKTTGTSLQHRRLAGGERKRDTSAGIARVAFAPPSPSTSGTPDDGGIFSSLCRPEKFDEVFELGERLGRGAFSVVHKATHRASGKELAVKIVDKTRLRRTRSAQVDLGTILRRLSSEFTLLGTMGLCSNVTCVHAMYDDENVVYVVLDFAGGGDLQDYFENHHPLSQKQVAWIMYEAIKAVLACHSCKIVHSDIKPANFLLMRREADAAMHGEYVGPFLLLTDFGMAQSLQEKKFLRKPKGTPLFMAPEVFRKSYTELADMWSLGVMMYYLLSGGMSPFWKKWGHPVSVTPATIWDHMSKFPPDVQPDFELESISALSPHGQDLLRRLLNPYMWERCTAYQAIIHPWFGEHLQCHPMGFELPTRCDSHALAARLGYLTLDVCKNCDMEACPISGAHDVLSSHQFDASN